jgi:hypothetical protein
MGGYGASYSYDDSVDVVKKSAKAYNIDMKREYTAPKEEKSRLPPPLNKIMLTKAKLPIVIAVDVTGSMKEYPKMIFEKLCILYNETVYFLPDKLKDSFEISFCAVGDAYSDAYPIQVTDFASKADLDKNLSLLFPEGGGGGQARESYELMAYYYAYRCQLANGGKKPRPMFFFIGDENFYNRVNRSQIMEYIGDPPATDLITTDVFNELKKKFDTYMLRIPYDDAAEEAEINASWQSALGKDRVIMLKDPRRVVDTILGLIAANVENFGLFKKRIQIRQTPEQVEQVLSTLDGMQIDGTKYVYNLQVLSCPACGAALDKIPDFNKPEKCPFCGVFVARI